MTPLERAIAAINNTARVQDISGDQQGVLGNGPLYVVTNPEELARAVLAAIRGPSEAMKASGAERMSVDPELGHHEAAPESIWYAMIDAMLEEGA